MPPGGKTLNPRLRGSVRIPEIRGQNLRELREKFGIKGLSFVGVARADIDHKVLRDLADSIAPNIKILPDGTDGMFNFAKIFLDGVKDVHLPFVVEARLRELRGETGIESQFQFAREAEKIPIDSKLLSGLSSLVEGMELAGKKGTGKGKGSGKGKGRRGKKEDPKPSATPREQPLTRAQRRARDKAARKADARQAKAERREALATHQKAVDEGRGRKIGGKIVTIAPNRLYVDGVGASFAQVIIGVNWFISSLVEKNPAAEPIVSLLHEVRDVSPKAGLMFAILIGAATPEWKVDFFNDIGRVDRQLGRPESVQYTAEAIESAFVHLFPRVEIPEMGVWDKPVRYFNEKDESVNVLDVLNIVSQLSSGGIAEPIISETEIRFGPVRFKRSDLIGYYRDFLTTTVDTATRMGIDGAETLSSMAMVMSTDRPKVESKITETAALKAFFPPPRKRIAGQATTEASLVAGTKSLFEQGVRANFEPLSAIAFLQPDQIGTTADSRRSVTLLTNAETLIPVLGYGQLIQIFMEKLEFYGTREAEYDELLDTVEHMTTFIEDGSVPFMTRALVVDLFTQLGRSDRELGIEISTMIKTNHEGPEMLASAIRQLYTEKMPYGTELLAEIESGKQVEWTEAELDSDLIDNSGINGDMQRLLVEESGLLTRSETVKLAIAIAELRDPPIPVDEVSPVLKRGLALKFPGLKRWQNLISRPTKIRTALSRVVEWTSPNGLGVDQATAKRTLKEAIDNPGALRTLITLAFNSTKTAGNSKLAATSFEFARYLNFMAETNGGSIHGDTLNTSIRAGAAASNLQARAEFFSLLHLAKEGKSVEIVRTDREFRDTRHNFNVINGNGETSHIAVVVADATIKSSSLETIKSSLITAAEKLERPGLSEVKTAQLYIVRQRHLYDSGIIDLVDQEIKTNPKLDIIDKFEITLLDPEALDGKCHDIPIESDIVID